MSQLDRARGRVQGAHAKCRFAKMLMRVEPCDRTLGYRRGTKREASRSQRRLDRWLTEEAQDG